MVLTPERERERRERKERRARKEEKISFSPLPPPVLLAVRRKDRPIALF